MLSFSWYLTTRICFQVFYCPPSLKCQSSCWDLNTGARANSSHVQWLTNATKDLSQQRQDNNSGTDKALLSTQEPCAAFGCTASNAPLICWKRTWLNRKWRRDILFSCDVVTTTQLPAPFPELLHVPCGTLTPFLPVTAAFGLTLFTTYLHKSKHLGDTPWHEESWADEAHTIFSPNLLPFFLDWFSKLSVTPIMQVYQPYRLNDSSLFSGFQHHGNAWKNEF